MDGEEFKFVRTPPESDVSDQMSREMDMGESTPPLAVSQPT